MPKHIRNRLLVIVLVALAALICGLPSFTTNLPAWWQKVLPTRGIHLGLDLQGGMHLILKVDISKAVARQTELSLDDLRDALRRHRISMMQPEARGQGRLRLPLADAAAVGEARRIISDQFSDLEITGSGPDYIDISLKPADIKRVQDDAVEQSLEIIRNRIDQFGVQEPIIARQGRDEIVVELAGVQDPGRALQIIGRTAQLDFKLVDPTQPADLEARVQEALRSGRLPPAFTHQQLNEALKDEIPADSEVYMEKSENGQDGAQGEIPILLERPTLMTGEALKTARMQIGGRYGRPYVSLTFNERGAKLFQRITSEHVNRRLAIILDNVVQSAPVIEEPIAGGHAQITGTFTAEQAHDLAIVLRSGALPAPVHIVQNVTVGPSLGRDSIHKGLASTLLGALLVVVFMVIYYRLSGLIANYALFLNLVLMLGALSALQATLTLPGIAGIVLSIGMAVDSNVLIFERMREEPALQTNIYAGVRAGYDKALWTIVDAHVTTLITAAALFLFGTGPIKGFAVTLSMGVVFNLFTALFGTRVIYDYLHFHRKLKQIRFLHLIRKPAIDFIRLRRIAFVVSGLLVALGLFAVLRIEQGRANLGVDFTGGAVIQFKAGRDFKLDAIRAALAKGDLTDYQLQEVPGERILMIRIKQSNQAMGSLADKTAALLQQQLPGYHFVMQSKAEIGATVSRDLRRAALVAIAISLAGIILYLAWRFDYRFGVAATVATFHDVLAVLGIFYLLDKEVTLLIVTALLTLAGYSLTDTVVVFDRIRENLRKPGRTDLKTTINRSINEVLSRTVITSGTVAMVLVALLLMGGVLLHDFALALLIGVAVGTYSSIFVASPLVYLWETTGKGSSAKKNRGIAGRKR